VPGRIGVDLEIVRGITAPGGLQDGGPQGHHALMRDLEVVDP
jgi:hypothetical protein